MEMARIISCNVNECAYNQNDTCHAMAITVGGGPDHRCDTFFTAPAKGGSPETQGAVGACRTTACMYNQNLECAAPGIRIGREGQDIDCLTFAEC